MSQKLRVLMNKIKKLLRHLRNSFPKVTGDIVIYGIGGSLAQFVGLVTIPIITRILASDKVGIVDVVNATQGYFLVLISLNLVSGLMRYFYEVSNDAYRDRKNMVSSLVWFTVVFGGLIVWLTSLFSRQLSNVLFNTDTYAYAITLAIVSLPFTALKEILASVLRMQRKPLTYLFLNIAYALVNFLLILLFILDLKQGINGYFTAQVISGVFVVIASAWLCREHLGFTFSMKWFWVMAAYALPMLPGGLLNWGMMSINRILLTQYTTESQIAYYGIATKTAKVIELAVTAFIMGWLPVFMENINSASFHQKLDKVFRYFTYASLSLSALVVMFAKEFFFILAPAEYKIGIPLVGLLCLKQVITGLPYTFTIGIALKKKSYLVSVSTGIGVMVTILVSLMLSPDYGILGASIADVIGVTVYTLAMLLFSNRLLRINLHYKPVLASLATFIAVWMISVIVKIENSWLSLGMRIGLLIIFLITLFVIIDQKKLFNSINSKIHINNSNY